MVKVPVVICDLLMKLTTNLTVYRAEIDLLFVVCCLFYFHFTSKRMWDQCVWTSAVWMCAAGWHATMYQFWRQCCMKTVTSGASCTYPSWYHKTLTA